MPIVKGVIGRKRVNKMEQNIRKFGVFVATLALIASVLVMPNASAGDGDLSMTVEGDNGLTSYGAKYGRANFIGSVSSTSVDADEDLTITASFDSESGWDSNDASVGVWDGTSCAVGEEDDFGHGGYNFGTLSVTLDFCISVLVDGDSFDNGDSVEMVIDASSSNSTLDNVVNAQVVVSDWVSSTEDTVAKTFTESSANTTEDCASASSCHSYTITIHNNKVDSSGVAQALSDPIKISYNSATPGWRIESDDAGWDAMNVEATIGYIAPGESYNFVIEVSLSGGNALASSYVGNSVLAFQVSDDNNVIVFVNFEAIVEDNFAVSVSGSGNQYVDNGCEDGGYEIDWDVNIRNHGNKPDSFDVVFNTTDVVAEAWNIEGATDINTGNLPPKAEKGGYSLSVELTVPGGLPAGTTHGFTMTVTSVGDDTQTQTQEFSATVVQCYDISMVVATTTDSADPGSSADFSATVTNNGNGEDTVSLMAMGAGAWSPTLSESASTIASGSSTQVLFTLTVPSDASSTAKSGEAMVHAYSEDPDCATDKVNCDLEAYKACKDAIGECGVRTSQANITVDLSANQVFDITAGYYYNASMASASVQEGMSIQLKFNVTNNGNGNDNVGVALANAPSWVTLVQDSTPAGPGQTFTVTIDIAAPASGSLGAVAPFQVVATSQDGTTTSTTGDFTLTVVEKKTAGGPTTEEVDDDDGGLPGFGFLPAIAAIGAVLLLRRRL